MDYNSKHLAILRQPFLDLILEGKKTIESRFLMRRFAPYGKIQTGDTVLMKESGGLVLGEFTVSKVDTFSNLTKETFDRIKSTYGKEICSDADPTFWEKREHKKYAILINVLNPVRYKKPYNFPKKDMRAWIVFKI